MRSGRPKKSASVSLLTNLQRTNSASVAIQPSSRLSSKRANAALAPRMSAATNRHRRYSVGGQPDNEPDWSVTRPNSNASNTLAAA